MRSARTPHLRILAPAQVILVAGSLFLWSLPARAQTAPERLTDNEVKELIEQVDSGRDKFEGNLEGKFKDSVLRNPTGEVKVAAALQDYQDNIKKLKERFTDDYSASAEVGTVLKQASNFDKFLRDTPSVVKGRSEWEHHAADLKRLAAAYAATFPTPVVGTPTVRRINDKETAVTAENLAKAGDKVKDAYDSVPDTALPKATKDGIKKELELLVKHTENVKSRTGDHKPATAEMKQVVAQVSVVQKLLTAHPLPAAKTSWDTVQSELAKLKQAFNL
jgi:hypothetical protein